MDILFNLGSKQRNGTDDIDKDTLQSKNQSVMYAVVISCFHSILRQKT